jgi:hypothetical protein
MISPGNSCSSQGFFLYFIFCSGFVLCKLLNISLSIMALGEVYQMLTQHQACSLLFILHWGSSVHSPYQFLSLTSKMVLDPSRSFFQKGASVSLDCHTQWYFGLTFCSFWPCFYLWEWLIIQPLVLYSLTDLSPWDPKEVYYPHQGNLGLSYIMTLPYIFHMLSSSYIMASTFKDSPPQSVIGNSNNNTFTFSTCLGMVILFYD